MLFTVNVFTVIIVISLALDVIMRLQMYFYSMNEVCLPHRIRIFEENNIQ